jgi:hypothetical protein
MTARFWVVVLLTVGLGACGGEMSSTPEGWRAVRVGDGAALSVPSDATEQSLQPIDSVMGVLHGDGYEVVYDFGRSAEDLGLYTGEPGYTSRSRTVGGRSGVEVTFEAAGSPWRVVRILQARDDENTLTVRVSCVDEKVCRMADDVFDSVRFGAMPTS